MLYFEVKMKRISTILFVLTVLVLLAVVPAAAFAQSTADANRSLINPAAIVTVDNYIFVADNVDETNNQSAILCFDVTPSQPSYRYTYTTTQKIVNLAEVDGQLYVMYADSVEVFEVGATQLTKTKTLELENVVDFTFGYYGDRNGDDALPYYAADRVYALDDTSSLPMDSATENATACAVVDGQLYFVKDGNALKRLNLNVGEGIIPSFDSNDPLNKNGVSLAMTEILGIFSYKVNGETQLALFGENGAYTLQQISPEYFSARELIPASSNVTVKDMCYGAGKIFLLNSANEVEIYSYNTEKQQFERQPATIGTDTITIDGQLPTPVQFTGFTLASSKGYPTNIVYKTTDASTSISEIKTDYTGQFIILDFEGAEDLPFYYVLIGDKFGWVQKSDGVTLPQNDSRLTIVNTQISQDVTYKAKFTSLNTVFIYPLPLSDIEPSDTFQQSIANPQEAKLLQKFTENHADGTVTEWYRVEYGEGKTGFVSAGNVGQFHATGAPTSAEEVIGYKKINSSLFEAVKIYLTSDMEESEAICDEYGDVIKLYSGSQVVAVKEENNATFVEIRKNDGSTSYGWIPTDNLIGLHQITTNAIVGLSILGVALILTVVFVVLFVKRKKIRIKVEDDDIDD